MHTYRRLPVTFDRGEGAWLWDTNGKRYLDALSGISVCNLGHAHPAVTQALCEQAKRLVHTSNLFHVAQQQALAQTLIRLTGMQNVFFGNSGAEANEAAIKIARLYGHQRGIKTPTIVVTENSFHGRTLATLTATGNRKIQAGFEPLVQGFVRVPYDDADALENVANHHSDVVAVLVEPIQGEGGIRIPSADYLNRVRTLCDANNWLLMVDEIQTGMCRTGKWIACQHNGIRADVVTLAKALGNGVPIGACLASDNAADIFQPGNHGSTFGGNPLACHVANTVLDVMESQHLGDTSARRGDSIKQAFATALADNPAVKEVRGLGMMLGIELTRDCGELVQIALDEGLIINVTARNVIRLLPPLIIDDVQCETLIATLTRVINTFSSNLPGKQS